MFNKKKRSTQGVERVDFSTGSDIASLLRSGQLLAVRRPDGQIGYVVAQMASDEQRQQALDAETVIRIQGLSDTAVN